MFVYSLRASTVKFFGVTVLSVAALVTLLIFIPTAETAVSGGVVDVSETVRFDKIKTAEDRISFLRQFGIEVDPEPVEEAEVTIPAEFDKVYTSYNELQKRQGFDLTRYQKKDAMRYTYRVTNYEGYDGEVLVSMIVYKKTVIGGDVCSAEHDGFIHGFDKNIEY